jgi:hypothetical protein
MKTYSFKWKNCPALEATGLKLMNAREIFKRAGKSTLVE